MDIVEYMINRNKYKVKSLCSKNIVIATPTFRYL